MINHWISKRRLKNDEIQKNNLYYISNDTFDRTGGRAGAGEAKGKLRRKVHWILAHFLPQPERK